MEKKTELQKSNNQANPVMDMLQMAMVNSDVDLEKMDKIMKMAERYEAKIADRDFKKSMALLQGKMPEISKDGKIIVNGQVRSDYAKYETIMRAIKPSLAKNGFAVSFKTRFEKDLLIVDCIVSHKGGHTETTNIQLPFDNSGSKNTVQSIGSSISYGKRYSLCMNLNIPTGGEDNDANKPEAPARSIKELFKMVSKATNIDELQLLWECFTEAEKVIAKDVVNVRKADITKESP